MQNTTIGAEISDILLDVFKNRSLCSEIDSRLALLLEMRTDVWKQVQLSQGEEGGLNDETALLVPFLLFVGSLMAVFLGARLFRPTAAIAAAMFGFYAVYSFGRMFSSGISCEALLGVASRAGLVAALATGCVLKAALFLIGSSATAAVVHLTFSMFPQLHTVGDQPTFAEQSLSYWGLMLMAGIGGGLVVRWHTDAILEVLTACAGGAGVAYSLHAIALLLSGTDNAPDRRIFFGCGVLAVLMGIIVQRRFRKRGYVCKKSKSDT